MPLNPDEQFTVIVASRREIAVQLNDRMDRLDCTHGRPQHKLSEGDERLTTQICNDHARRLGELGRFYPNCDAMASDPDWQVDEEHDDYLDDTLRDLGLLAKGEADET